MGSERKIEFKNEQGQTIRGWLKLPEGQGPHALVILAHGFSGLKEWTIPVVADAFVAEGIAALAFDYRNWGDSDGTPREETDWPGQIEDWRNAITYATTLPEIDGNRIGIWGTSLGGQWVLIVAGLDRRVKAVFSQVPPINFGSIIENTMNNKDQREELLRAIDEDRKNRFLGKEPAYDTVSLVTPGTETYEFMQSLNEEERRNWKARISLRSYERNVASDALPYMKLISPTPLFMLVAAQDTLCPTAQTLEAYEAALQPKELALLPGRHYDFYKSPHREKAITLACGFFKKHLLS